MDVNKSNLLFLMISSHRFNWAVWVKRENVAYYRRISFYGRLECSADEIWIGVSEVNFSTKTPKQFFIPLEPGSVYVSTTN